MKRNLPKHPCNGCIYLEGCYEQSATCDYYLITGKRRPCEPGKGCTVRLETRKRKVKRKESSDNA